jgi:cytochrome c oxidase cbb3-type subunit III
MPAWGSKIPRYQIWQLVSYVRSMSGLVKSDVAPNRNDSMMARPPEAMTPTGHPKQ